MVELYKLNFGDVFTIGIGDSPNDQEMLAALDMRLLVQTVNRRWNKVNVKKLRRITGVGPEGWARAASILLLHHLTP